MQQWLILFRKEMLENIRNFKWMWVPLVFILLAAMDPVTTYYMPTILKAAGGLPEGAVFEMPMPNAAEAIMMSLAQLSSLGVLVIALISMGTIAGERKSGVSELILVKPVSYFNYITAKWASYILLLLTSLLLALLASWYYVTLFFGSLTITHILGAFLFYGLWLSLIVTISIFYNAWISSQGAIAAATIGTVILISTISSIFGTKLSWSPVNITEHLHEMLITNAVPSALYGAAGITVLCIICLLMGAIFIFQSRYAPRKSE